MDDKGKCKISECCKNHGCKIFGIILVVIATILTIITFNGLGILGMFIVGLMLCGHKHLSSKMGCGCDCGCSCCAPECCTEEGLCNTHLKHDVVVEKKS